MKKLSFLIFMSISLILVGCNAAEQEREEYFDATEEKYEEHLEDIDSALEDVTDTVLDSKPEEAMAILNDEVIPKYEAFIKDIEDVELKDNDLLIELNDLTVEVLESELDKLSMLSDLFADIMEKKETDEGEDIDLDTRLEAFYESSEEQVEKTDAFVDKIKEVAKEYDDTDLNNEDDPVNADLDEIYDGYEEIIMLFVDSVGGLSHAPKEAAAVSKDVLEDQGNTEVVFDGKVTLDETFQLEGESNLPGGSVLQLKTYEYGTENPYFRGDIPVEDDGSFSVEADIEDDALNGELLVVRIAYVPDTTDNRQNVGVYGEEGELLEGDFIHPYTNIKRTRNGAFAYAYLDLNDGEEAKLEPDVWGEAPEDYGDLDIWVEEAHVEAHDKYYDVTMNSNLAELTYIKAEVKMPGAELNGYSSTTKVLPDGSFRFQIPRPEVEGNDVSIEVNALSDFAIETEELYGENGEKFKGDLVESTKKGQKIQYEFPVVEE